MKPNPISTDGIKLVESVGRFCATAGYACLVRGVPSAGTTTALLNLRNRYPEFGLPGERHFHSFSLREDPIRVLSSMLESNREARELKKARADSEIERCLTRILEQNIRLFIFDRCHNISCESLDRLLDMIDVCAQSDRQVGFVLGGRNFSHNTLQWDLSDRSKVARSVIMPLLDRDHCVAALKQFSQQFDGFCHDFMKGSEAALTVAEGIYNMTGGRIGELRKLFDYLNYLHPQGNFSIPEILKRAKELTFHG
jgi:hypothetical protein